MVPLLTKFLFWLKRILLIKKLLKLMLKKIVKFQKKNIKLLNIQVFQQFLEQVLMELLFIIEQIKKVI